MMAPALPVAWLAALAAMGVALLGRAAPWLTALERVAYGAVLGVVLGSLAVLGGSCVAGRMPLALVAGVGLLAALLTILLQRRRTAPQVAGVAAMPIPGDTPRPARAAGFDTGTLVAVLVVAAFAVRWAFLWWSALTVNAEGLYVSHVHLWGDWALHLGDTMMFAWGDNFPPMHPRFAGPPHSYHYLTSITAAALVRLGMDPLAALPFQSWALSVLTILAVLAFARRITGSMGVAALALVLFLLGGGLGWWVTLAEGIQRHDVLGTLRDHTWDAPLQEKLGLRWLNVQYAFLIPQRGTLYGFPLGLLALTCVHEGHRRRATWPFVLGGLALGLLPFAHLGTLLSLAMLSPFLVLLLPTWRWIGFFLAWGLVGGPQFLAQQGGSAGALQAFRWQWGWVAGDQNVLLFWLRNLGAFAVLIPLALAAGGLLERRERRMMWAFMPLFVAANLAVFQPWAWDNTKLLVWWWLAACVLVAAWMVRVWRDERLPARSILLVLGVSMVLTGLLVDLDQALGHGRHRLLTHDELRVAREVREKTPRRSVFVVGLQHNHPVTVLGGRRAIMGYPGWLWTQGVSYGSRRREVGRILALAPDAEDLLRRYRVDFVAVGPEERRNFGADSAAWHARWPVVIATRDYQIFDVRGARR
jgi:hypothetical protein